MNLSLKNESSRFNHSPNRQKEGQGKPDTGRGDKKSKNILQLKDELVKMKNFLNQELPEISKLIPQKGSMKDPGSARNSEQISSVEIEKIVSINRRLFTQNEKLVAELTRQRSQKKQLSKSLKKQEKMLSQLCDNSHRDLQHRHEELRKLTRKASLGQNNYISQLHLNSPKKSFYPPLPNSKQKASIWHTRKQSPSLSQKFQTQTSILNTQEKTKQKQKAKKDKAVKQTAPCYSESEEEMITNLKEIADLQGKLKELMAESRLTENRTKKLQLRNQMEKVANRLHCLKESLGQIG